MGEAALNWARRTFRTGAWLTSSERTVARLMTSVKSMTSRSGFPRKKSWYLRAPSALTSTASRPVVVGLAHGEDARGRAPVGARSGRSTPAVASRAAACEA